MTGLREQQKRVRREAILAAAARLFAEKGYGATGVEEIAAAAGVSLPTLYAYTASKGDLVVALYERGRATLDAAKQALINAPQEDPADAIAAMLLLELRHAEAFPAAAWREAAATALRSGGGYQAGLDRLGARVFDEPLRRLLRTLQRLGRLADDLDVDAAVALFGDLVTAVFHQRIARDHSRDWVEQRVRRHVATALRGMRAG